MIIFGDNNIVPYLLSDRERYFVLNFFNTTNLGDRLDKLWVPSIILQATALESREFDMLYANYILTEDGAFTAFMEIMMAMYYNDGDVFILTDLSSPPVVNMCESIIKLIQQRYGYNCYMANSVEDVFEIPDSNMSEIGVQIFMQDKERYVYLTVDPKTLLSNIDAIDEQNV